MHAQNSHNGTNSIIQLRIFQDVILCNLRSNAMKAQAFPLHHLRLPGNDGQPLNVEKLEQGLLIDPHCYHTIVCCSTKRQTSGPSSSSNSSYARSDSVRTKWTTISQNTGSLLSFDAVSSVDTDSCLLATDWLFPWAERKVYTSTKNILLTSPASSWNHSRHISNECVNYAYYSLTKNIWLPLHRTVSLVTRKQRNITIARRTCRSKLRAETAPPSCWNSLHHQDESYEQLGRFVLEKENAVLNLLWSTGRVVPPENRTEEYNRFSSVSGAGVWSLQCRAQASLPRKTEAVSPTATEWPRRPNYERRSAPVLSNGLRYSGMTAVRIQYSSEVTRQDCSTQSMLFWRYRLESQLLGRTRSRNQIPPSLPCT